MEHNHHLNLPKNLKRGNSLILTLVLTLWPFCWSHMEASYCTFRFGCNILAQMMQLINFQCTLLWILLHSVSPSRRVVIAKICIEFERGCKTKLARRPCFCVEVPEYWPPTKMHSGLKHLLTSDHDAFWDKCKSFQIFRKVKTKVLVTWLDPIL